MVERQKSKNKFFLLLFGLMICAISVYYIYRSFQWTEIRTVLKDANPILFFCGSTVSLVLYWLTRCLRWYVLLREENNPIPFWRLYLYTVIMLSFSTMTPLRTGEALKVELIRKHNAGRMSGYTNFAIERFLDLSTVVGFALFGLSGELSIRLAAHIYLVGLVLALVGLISLLAVFRLPANVFDKIRGIVKERIKFSVLVRVIVLTIISWVLIACGWHLALQSIGIYLDLHQMTLLLALAILAGILSFVPGSVGVSEISISQILIQMGYQTNLAQSGALIIRGYFLMILVLGLIHFLLLKLAEKRSN